MRVASYKIVHHADAWRIESDGMMDGAYATKEIAFEVAASAASDAIKRGHEIHIFVPGSGGNRPALGTP
jgi:hypothetical protein